MPNYKKAYQKKRTAKLTQGMRKAVGKVVNAKLRKNTELKYFDVATSGATNVDWTGLFHNLCIPAQGDTDVTRDGDKLNMKKLRLRCSIVQGDSYNNIRIIIFRWKQNNISVTPSASYLISPYQGTAMSPVAPYNWDTKDNTQILYDRVYTVDTSYPQRMVKINLNLSKLPKVAFDSGTTGGNNHLYMFIVSDSSAATHPTYNLLSRVSFTDS